MESAQVEQKVSGQVRIISRAEGGDEPGKNDEGISDLHI